MRKRLLNFANQAVLWLSVLFMGFLSVVSLVSTSYFTKDTSFAERPQYRIDNILVNVLFLVVFLGILYVINRKLDLEKIPVKILAAAAVLFVVGMSLLWVTVSHTYPEADQKAVSWVAYLITQGNFLFFEPGKYMQIYPNQLGLTAILELLYRVTGGENWKVFMHLTAVANGAVTYLLYKITDKLFQKKRATIIVLFAAMGCIQIILYTTFLYGIMLGLALSLAAFLFLLYSLEEKNRGWKGLAFGLLSGVCIGAAILVKNNYSIFLVAMVILLLYKAWEQKKVQALATAILIVLLSSLMGTALTGFYEERSGMEISSGMPKSLWIAMGMQEGERAEGWYNAFNYDTFLETGCNIEESDRIAKEAIEESLQKFKEDPAYAADFYYKKAVSQWNEPTYEALWVNQFHSGDFSKIVQSIYDGKLYVVMHEYMNLYQSLIFMSVLICLISRRKSWQLEQLFLLIVILGGFLFHTIWEAKSQYIFPYFVILLPFAAVGISELLERSNRRA